MCRVIKEFESPTEDLEWSVLVEADEVWIERHFEEEALMRAN